MIHTIDEKGEIHGVHEIFAAAWRERSFVRISLHIRTVYSLK